MFGAIVGFAAAVVVAVLFPATWAKVMVVGRLGVNAVAPVVSRIKVAVEKERA